jgi:hypothetical protein
MQALHVWHPYQSHSVSAGCLIQKKQSPLSFKAFFFASGS